MLRLGMAFGLLCLMSTACAAAGAEGSGTTPANPDQTCEALAAETEVAAIVSAGEPVDGLALAIAACLGHTDPDIRDGFAYGSLARLMRAGLVTEATRRDLLQALSGDLSPEADDPEGFLKPFAALVLSEVARTDRVDPWMSDEERTRLVETGAVYVERVDDYRGFDDQEGWRHGVAHGADLLMQLSLNPAIGEAEARRILDAIGGQIASDEAPAFIFDEPRRLSRPVLFLTQKGLLSEGELTSWFESLAQPAPLSDWEEAFGSESALARRHNLRAFAYAVLVAATENEEENLKRLRPGALHILSTIP
ncbi:MAG: DUF2785 domain-containing protein [Henriciella sp.]|uniref:DUF2785 domain-containing protein n=1 Tax=Henriciella sp. TaxID=1968823 RepID=UPI0032F06C45